MGRRKNELDFPESGNLIRHYRKLQGLSIKELAALIVKYYKVLGVPMERLLVSVPPNTDDRLNQILLLIERATPHQLDVLERFISCVLPMIDSKECNR